MSKAADAGKSFLAGVFAKLTPEQRTQAEAIFASADANAALEVIGTGALAQPEISRQLDSLKTQREELDARQQELEDWFAPNKAALEEYVTMKPEFDRLKAGGGGGGGHKDDHKETSGMTKEEIAASLEARDRAFAGALALTMDLSARHYAMFSEPLNTTELLADPKLGTVIDRATGKVYGLQDAYAAKHGERVQTKATEAETARINKLVDEQVKERLKTMPQNQSHPFPLRDSSPSPLDALADTQRKTTDYSVDSAVAKYEELSQTRAGTSA
jgi:hypothetical protein